MATILKNIKRKFARKKELPEETLETDVGAEDNEDEIIDLVDPLEEDSYTPDETFTGEEEPEVALSEEPSDAKIEKDLETVGEGEDKFEQTLEAEFLGDDAWKIPQRPASENMTDQDLEESLLELFESSESFVSELVEKRQELGEKDEEISSTEHLLDDRPVDLQVIAEASK